MPTRIFLKSTFIFLASIPLLTPLFFTWSTYESFYIPKLFLLELLTILTLLSLALTFIFHKLPSGLLPYRPLVPYLPVAAFVGWSGISLLPAYNPHAAQSYLLLLCQAVVSFLALLLVRDARRRLLLCRVMIIAAFIAACIGIAQYFGFRYEKGLEWVSGGGLEKLDIYSTSGNPNFLGAYLIAILPIAVMCGLAKIDKDTGWLWFYRVATVTMLLCLIYTRTKGAWIGAGASLVYLVVFYRPSLSTAMIKGKGLIVIVCLAAALAIGLYLSGSIDWIIKEIKSLQAGHITIRGRLFLWQVTLSMISDHPFAGIGWGNYRAYFQEYQGRFLEARSDYISVLTTQGSAESSHNEFLEIAAETGLTGLFLFILVIWTVFRLAGRARAMDCEMKKAMTIASAAGVLAVLVHSLFVFPLHLVDAGMIFWLEIGLIYALTLPDVEASSIEGRAGGRGMTAVRVNVAIVAVLLSGVLIFSAFRPVMASVYHKMAWEAMAREQFPAAIRLAEEGMKWSAFNDELYLLSGSAKYQLGLVRASIVDFRKAYELYPDYMILFNLGLSYKRLGLLNEAADYLLKAVYVRPNLKQAYVELLEIFASKGDVAGQAFIREKMKRAGLL